VEFVATAVLCLAFCLPAASVIVAASIWRDKLTSPRLFVVGGLSLLYLLAGYLATRPIPTHAVMFKLDGSQAQQHDLLSPWLTLALLVLIVLAVASVAVLFILRRLLSR